jgi:RHS repeat-associated protein
MRLAIWLPAVAVVLGVPTAVIKANNHSLMPATAGADSDIIAGPRAVVAINANDVVVGLTTGEVADIGPASKRTLATIPNLVAVSGYQSADGVNHAIVGAADGDVWDLAYTDGAATQSKILTVSTDFGPVQALSAWVDAYGKQNIAIMSRQPTGSVVEVSQNGAEPALVLIQPDTDLGGPAVDVAGQYLNAGGVDSNCVVLATTNTLQQALWPAATIVDLDSAFDIIPSDSQFWATHFPSGGATQSLVSYSINNRWPGGNSDELSAALEGGFVNTQSQVLDYGANPSSALPPFLDWSFAAAPTSVSSYFGDGPMRVVALANGEIWRLTAPMTNGATPATWTAALLGTFSEQCSGGNCTSTFCSKVCSGPCQTCDSSGACVGCASGQICVGGTVCIPDHCSIATDCPTGYFCSVGNACTPLLTNGAAGSTTACASGFAAEGLCCDRACANGCERCDLPGSFGTCATVPAGQAERSSCADGYLCSGIATCTSSCSDDAQCANGFYCNGGACQPQSAQGGACTSSSQCGTGFCTDGVCCNSDCTAVDDSVGDQAPTGCGSCALANHMGTCTLAPIGSCANVPPFTPTPIPPGLSSSFVDITRFVYEGGTQRMADGSAIDPSTIRVDRAAVVRGMVRRAGAPLAGATVSVRNHPEYGQTLTRDDGEFDLAVNGGASLVVRVDAVNHPSVFREVFVRPLDYTKTADITLVPYGAAQQVDLTDTSQYHAVQSEVVGSGTSARQITVLFPPGSRIRQQYSTGSVDLAQPSIRITEYTKGDGDLDAMPSTLPPTSAYTFAANFFVEPPIGVTEKPSSTTFVDSSGNAIALPMYVDNFLGFPVGTTAPLGAYNETSAYWTANPSGAIVRILSVNGGVASVDDVGDGNAHNDHFPPDELRLLGSLYPNVTNRDFMRVMLPHFSDYDINQGVVPNCDPSVSSCFPADREPDVNSSPDDQTCRAGSIIECQAQTLGEAVPIAGTSFSLSYRSDRQLAYAARRTVTIPLDPLTFPGSMLAINVQIAIAGHIISRSFLPEQLDPTLHTLTVTWNGLDPFGRPLSGETQALVRWGYAYDAVYAQTSKFGYNGGGLISRGATDPGITTRQNLTLWTPWYTEWLASYDARSLGMGGWILDAYHHYDIQRGMLYPGGGRARHASAVAPWTIDTLAGGPNQKLTTFGTSYLGGLAIGPAGASYFTGPLAGGTALWEFRDGAVSSVLLTKDGSPFPIPNYNGALTADRDGVLYLAVSGALYRIVLNQTASGTTGQVTSYPTDTGTTCWVDKICGASALGAGVDGSIYAVHSSNISRVGPDGSISTIYGPGSVNPHTVTDGGLGIQAVAGAPDGSIYLVASNGLHRIERITPEGFRLNVTAAADFGAPIVDGSLASTARIDYVGPGMLLPTRDGSIYFGQSQGFVLRRVRPDGTLETVGGLASGTYQGDGGTALGSTIGGMSALAEGPLGDLQFLDLGYNSKSGLRHITPPRPSTVNQAVYVPSEDGSEIYIFDINGVHQQTLDAKTGAPRLAFVHVNGLLTEIQQFNSPNGVPILTEIDRTGGQVVVTGPYGLQTKINMDGDGYGSVITNPAAEQTKFGFTSTGWMSTEIDPRGNTHVFTADGLGRLIHDADPGGGAQTFTTDPSRALVRVTTAGNTPAEHEVTTSGGDVTLTDRFQSADDDLDRLVSTTTLANSGGRTYSETDGSTAQTQPCNDPRFGSQLDAVCASTSTSDSVTAATSTVQSATCAVSDCGVPVACDGSTLTILRTESDQHTVNGRTYTAQYDRCPNGAFAPLETITTPENRRMQLGYSTLGQVTSLGLVDTRPNPFYPVAYNYDDDGRLKSVTRGDRSLVLNYYPQSSDGSSGRPQSLTLSSSTADDDTHVVTYDRYDGAGRLLQATLPGARILALGRDGAGNVNSLTPPGKTAHLMPRDGLNRVALYQPPPVPDQTITAYQYDVDRRLSWVAQPGDLPVAASYDSRGRLTTLSHPSRSFTLTYEKGTAGSNSTPATLGYGRLRTVTDQAGVTLAYSYAPTGATPLSESWSGGAVTGSVSRTLDSDHRLQTESINGGNTITYGYDGDGLLTAAGDLTLTPDPVHGALTSTTLGAVSDARTYNRYGELATYTVTAAGNIVYQITYDDWATTNAKPRDNLGRVRRKTESIFNAGSGALDVSVRDYVYYSGGRLWKVLDGNTNVVLEDYELDANGNRTSATVNGVTVSNTQADAQDRLLTYGDATYTYTLQGQRRTKTAGGVTTTYDWDGYGNLTAVTEQNTRIEYLYDAQQRRIARKKWNLATAPMSLTEERHWLYEDQLRVVAELDGTGNLISRFVYGTRRSVPDYVIREDGVYRIITDRPGSVRLLVNIVDGSIAQRSDYVDVFGTPTVNIASSLIPFGFGGGILDSDTGLIHFGARDFDPHTGTWLAKDPLLLNGGDTNVNAYVGGDPVNRIDPSGTEYWNLNVGIGFFVGIDAGIIFQDGEMYPYVGGGLMSPGATAALTYSPNNAIPGHLSTSFSLVGGGAFTCSVDDGDPFSWAPAQETTWSQLFGTLSGEVGVGGPFGVSITNNYMFKTPIPAMPIPEMPPSGLMYGVHK